MPAGRRREEAVDFVNIRGACYHYFFRRWSRLLATACGNAFAASVADHFAQPCCVGTDRPLLTDQTTRASYPTTFRRAHGKLA